MDRNCQFSVIFAALSSTLCSCVRRHREFFLISYILWKDLLLSLETACCDGHQSQLLFLPSPSLLPRSLSSLFSNVWQMHTPGHIYLSITTLKVLRKGSLGGGQWHSMLEATWDTPGGKTSEQVSLQVGGGQVGLPALSSPSSTCSNTVPRVELAVSFPLGSDLTCWRCQKPRPAAIRFWCLESKVKAHSFFLCPALSIGKMPSWKTQSTPGTFTRAKMYFLILPSLLSLKNQTKTEINQQKQN